MKDALRLLFVCNTFSCAAEPPVALDVVQASLPGQTASISSSPASSASTQPAAETVELPPLYADLFVKGKRWSLALTFVDSEYDGAKRKQVQSTKKGTASCEVGEVAPMAAGLQAHIDCQGVEDNGVEQPLTGWWFATKKGLFRAGPSKTFDDALLIVEPVPRPRVEKTEEKERPSFGSKISVEQSGTAWCYESASWGGDEGWWQVCLKPGVGFQSGKWGWAGGSTHETMFELRK